MLEAEDLIFYDAAERNGRLWFVNAKYPALFSMGIDEKDFRLEYVFSGWTGGQHQFSNLVFWNQLLVIAPRNESCLLFFDTETKTLLETVPLERKYLPEGRAFHLFYGIAEYNDRIYCFPGAYGAVVIVHMPKKEISYLEISGSLRDGNGSSVRFRGHLIVHHIAVLPAFWENTVLLIDMERQSVQIRKLKIPESRGFHGAVRIGDQTLLLCRNAPQLFRFDGESGELIVRPNLQNAEILAVCFWCGRYLFSGRLNTGEMVYGYMDKETYSCTEMFSCEKFSGQMPVTPVMSCAGFAVLGFTRGRDMICTDRDGRMFLLPVSLQEDDRKRLESYIESYVWDSGVIRESEDVGLLDMIVQLNRQEETI